MGYLFVQMIIHSLLLILDFSLPHIYAPILPRSLVAPRRRMSAAAGCVAQLQRGGDVVGLGHGHVIRNVEERRRALALRCAERGGWVRVRARVQCRHPIVG